jgi:hypothetical protein
MKLLTLCWRPVSNVNLSIRRFKKHKELKYEPDKVSYHQKVFLGSLGLLLFTLKAFRAWSYSKTLSQESSVSNEEWLTLTLTLILILTHTPQNGEIQLGSPEYKAILHCLLTLDSTFSWDTEEKMFSLDAFMEIIKKT